MKICTDIKQKCSKTSLHLHCRNVSYVKCGGGVRNTHTRLSYTTKATSAQNEQKAKRQPTAEDSKALINAQDTLAAWPGYFVALFSHAMAPFSPLSAQFITLRRESFL